MRGKISSDSFPQLFLGYDGGRCYVIQDVLQSSCGHAGIERNVDAPRLKGAQNCSHHDGSPARHYCNAAPGLTSNCLQVHCQAGAEAVQGTIINADLAVTDGKLVRFGESVASDVFEKVLTHWAWSLCASEAPHDTVFAKESSQ